MTSALLLLTFGQIQARTPQSKADPNGPPVRLSYEKIGDGKIVLDERNLAAFIAQRIQIEEAAQAAIVESNAILKVATSSVEGANTRLAAEAEKKRLKIQSDRAVAENLASIADSKKGIEDQLVAVLRQNEVLGERLEQMGYTVAQVSARLAEAKKIGWIPFPISIFAEAISAKKHNRAFWPRN